MSRTGARLAQADLALFEAGLRAENRGDHLHITAPGGAVVVDYSEDGDYFTATATAGEDEWSEGALWVAALPGLVAGMLRELECSTCDSTGLVDWAPGQIRDIEGDQQPCPDCRLMRST